VPGAAAAYDADNPYMDITINGSEIVPNSHMGFYPYMPNQEIGVHSEEDVYDFMAAQYGMTAEEAQYAVDAWNNNRSFPEGVNVTINGAVRIDQTDVSTVYGYVFTSSGRAVYNGGMSDGTLVSFDLTNTPAEFEGYELTFNGNFSKKNRDVTVTARDSLIINGDISAHNDILDLSSQGDITVNGNIRVSGDSASATPIAIRYYAADYDQAGDYEKTKPYWIYFPIKAFDRTGIWETFHWPAMWDWLFEQKPGTVLRLGYLPEQLDHWIDDLVTLTGSEPQAPSSIRINGNITVENDFDTANSAQIALTGNGTDWSWKGGAAMPGAGCTNCALQEKGIYVYAYEGAVWQVEGLDSGTYSNYSKVSSISRWTSYGNTVIDMTKTPDTMLLKIDELVGSGTVIREKVDPNHTADGNLTDMVVLGGRSRGEHTVELHSTGAEPMEIRTGRVPYLQVTVPCAVSQRREGYDKTGEWYPWIHFVDYSEKISSALKLSTEENASGDGKVAHIQIDGTRYYTYWESGNGINEIVFEREFPELTINYGNLNNELDVGTRKYKILDPVVQPDGSVMFYIEMEGVLPDGTPVPTSDLPFNELSTGAELVTTLAGDGAVYSAWMADLSDLRKRLGEVRYGAQDGLWAKGIAQKDRIDGLTGANFKQKLYGLQFGLDHIVTQDEDRMWLLGANFKYNTVDQKVDAMRYGHGDLKTYGAFLYATYADYKGYYTDLVLSLDHYKQKMTAEQTDSSYVHGKYSTWGWGASVEVGRMFSSAQDDEGWGPWYGHWWIEPQAQLAYYWVNGKRFSMDNGMTVQQKNGDSLIGRLGVVIGKKFNYGRNRKEVDKRYSQFYLKGGVKHEFLGGQTVRVNNDTFNGKLRGTRVYYGAGFDWNMTDQLRLYAQVERESGSKYRKDYEVSVGLKWQF
jgi:outer membrane autotransporter protein